MLLMTVVCTPAELQRETLVWSGDSGSSGAAAVSRRGAVEVLHTSAFADFGKGVLVVPGSSESAEFDKDVVGVPGTSVSEELDKSVFVVPGSSESAEFDEDVVAVPGTSASVQFDKGVVVVLGMFVAAEFDGGVLLRPTAGLIERAAQALGALALCFLTLRQPISLGLATLCQVERPRVLSIQIC
jgi:hypothetical protein